MCVEDAVRRRGVARKLIEEAKIVAKDWGKSASGVSTLSIVQLLPTFAVLARQKHMVLISAVSCLLQRFSGGHSLKSSQA